MVVQSPFSSDTNLLPKRESSLDERVQDLAISNGTKHQSEDNGYEEDFEEYVEVEYGDDWESGSE